ncbi:MAG TPA: protein kinase, partial [Candidatus Eisenbacteria bacterium]|nr:protein kinase [Candidatus Eisenbacteria bacterium]
MPLANGTRLGTYEIVGLLGSGGMGEVYRAKDLRLGRDIALKVLPETLARNADHLARFEHEARTVAGLNHPSIVTLHSVEDTDGIRFITMELVEGQSLADLVTPGGLPLTRVLDVAIAIADALTAAHERRVVHRDLKPANVMVTREGRVKVLDFGLAKGAPPTTDDSEGLTVGAFSSPGHVAGTAPYMAPEQIRGEAVDARTDLFAFGILLYELLTGQRPFAAPTTMALCAAILHEAPAPLAPARADLPPDVGRIVTRCLEKDPRERIQTALDVSHELRQVRKSLEAVHAPRSTSEKIASIAVLPFANRSASADDEYFSDGLADELLNVLARIKGLRVTARSSAFTFKGKQATAAEIGRALNVATLLDGSVRKSGSRIRVSVQLVDVADSSHLWSETYDRTLEDIFAVQDDIAQSVVKELRTTLLGEEADSDASGAVKVDVAQAAKGRGTDPEAHRLLLLARHLLNRFTREDVSKAVGYLKEALARDPEYALAWAELGRAQSMEADLHHVPPSEGYARAREATKRALALAPDLPEGLAVMAWIQLVCDLDYRGAAASYARALELAPGSANVLRGACAMASALGRHEEAIDLARRALEQDPLSAPSYHNLGAALDAADRLAESEAALRKEL